MGILSALGGFFGGPLGYGLGSLVEGKSSATVSYGKPVDYSEALQYASDNNKTTALGQIQAQGFALQQASLDRQMQLAAQLELGIEKLDTKLQASKLEYVQRMTAEENRHVEKVARSGGIPEPEVI
ncbi:MAG TPA: hypothetical protein VLJ37_08710 [bacterium]|nr:hypothetical protein [bacterium]